MYQSKLFLTTLRELSADAEVVSHQLMLRAGLIRRVASGIYTYLPLGKRVLRKVEQIVREEMDRAGAQEMLMPALQPTELWKESGRYSVYGSELIRLYDRHDREFALGPTHEEVVTSIVRNEISSYRKLPLILYQIQTKFRDERRPRFGLLRSREFLMKDAYSFDSDWEGLDKSYQTMFEAYHRIFTALGLHYRAVEADGGAIGGEGGTHEFMALADIGEDTIATCNECSYAANLEKAESSFQHMDVKKQQISTSNRLEKIHTPNTCTIQELVQYLGIEEQYILKTLLYMADDQLIAVVVRGNHDVNEVKVKNYLQAEHIRLAEVNEINSDIATAAGYIGPIGLTIPTLIDQSVLAIRDGVAGANEINYHYQHVDVSRDFPLTHTGDFRDVVQGDICPRCQQGKLQFYRGIEMGHVFKLGTKYSEQLGANILNHSGKAQPMMMGCYGIGVSRILSAVIEQNHDEQGIIWPISLAPYHVHIILISAKHEIQHELAESLREKLESNRIEVLIDDRDERPGVKFKDSDLIGIPYRIIVGKDAVHQKVEWVERRTNMKEMISADAAVERVISLCIGNIHIGRSWN